MIYTYTELLKKYKNRYQINLALKNNEIYKVEKGIYSNKKFINPMIIYTKKYPNAIITMDSAFYYYDLTDVIPDKLYLATPSNAHKISNKKIKQYFTSKKIIEYGKTTIKIGGENVNIYNKERLLIELIRRKNTIPFDYYKELILNYREITNELDVYKIEEYVSLYKNEVNIFDTIQREVF